MSAQSALDELTEISAQVEAAVVLGADGDVQGSTLGEAGTQAFAAAARALLDAAAEGGRDVQQLDAATSGGSVFVVRDGERTIAATTSAEPTVGLVFYDLKSCLRTITAAELATAEEKPKPKRPRRKKDATDADA